MVLQALFKRLTRGGMQSPSAGWENLEAMKWYVKALVQNAVALIPERVAQPMYFQLQRRLGELRDPPFSMRFAAACDMVASMNARHTGVAGKSVMEVGTGRFLDVPIALWLMGADEIVTVDLNRLLRADLVSEGIAFLRQHWDVWRPRFAEHGDVAVVDQRFERLCQVSAGGLAGEADLARLMAALNVDYRSPADAANMPESDERFDYLVTFVVLQHVPPEPLAAIVAEGRRLLKTNGRQIHICNTCDHFSFVDPALSPIDFLRWSERQWQLIAGNRYMYQNRLRADGYYAIFEAAGLETVHVKEQLSERGLADLRAGFPLHEDWRGSAPERDAVGRFQVMLKRSVAAEPAQGE